MRAAKKQHLWEWFHNHEPVMNFLPLEIRPPQVVISTLHVRCKGCDEPMGGVHYRGTVRRHEATGEHIIQAVGLCTECNLLHWSAIQVGEVDGEFTYEQVHNHFPSPSSRMLEEVRL